MRKLFLKIAFFSFLILLTSCEKRQTVITGVDEREANLIVVFLDSKGIEAKKKEMPSGGAAAESGPPKFMIEVDPKNAINAMAFLNQSGLPRKQGTTLLELFAKSGLMSSDREETIRYQAGLEQQIVNTIMMIDGVIDAAVQISFPPSDATAVTQAKITAAVYVKHQGVIDDPNSHLETKIKRIVSGSVNGLDINDVTVVSDRSRYTDIAPADLKKVDPQTREYINIWSMVMSRNSITKFRTLFFSLTILVMVFALMTAWLLWKMYPIIRKMGFGTLFKTQPILEEKKSSEPVKEE
jgi:type III secretion protein J